MFKLSLRPKVKRILRYLLQANDEIRPLRSNLRNLVKDANYFM